MLGRPREERRAREEKFPLHESCLTSSRASCPGPVPAALDAARARARRRRSKRYAAALLRATPPGDARQWAFSASAVMRALVLAGRDAEAVAGARGERILHGVLASAALVGSRRRARRSQAPETSTARVPGPRPRSPRRSGRRIAPAARA